MIEKGKIGGMAVLCLLCTIRATCIDLIQVLDRSIKLLFLPTLSVVSTHSSTLYSNFGFLNP